MKDLTVTLTERQRHLIDLALTLMHNSDHLDEEVNARDRINAMRCIEMIKDNREEWKACGVVCEEVHDLSDLVWPEGEFARPSDGAMRGPNHPVQLGVQTTPMES